MYQEPRRHRLNRDETPIVMNLLYNELTNLSSEQSDAVLAEEIWHILIRFEENSIGRPSYPDFTWKRLKKWLNRERKT